MTSEESKLLKSGDIIIANNHYREYINIKYWLVKGKEYVFESFKDNLFIYLKGFNGQVWYYYGNFDITPIPIVFISPATNRLDTIE